MKLWWWFARCYFYVLILYWALWQTDSLVIFLLFWVNTTLSVSSCFFPSDYFLQVLKEFLKLIIFHAVANSGKILESDVRSWLPKPSDHPNIVEYAANFTVPNDFGRPGAVLITNLHDKEFYLMEIVIHNLEGGPLFFPANSWIHPRKDNPDSRIIFRNQVS